MSDFKVATFDPETKVWTGNVGNYKLPMDKFLGAELLKALDRTPNRVIQINHEEGTELLCKDLRTSSIRVAKNLQKSGIEADDVVGFICKNSHNLNAIVYGCVLVGAIINPLHVSFTKSDIKQMFCETKPKIVVCDSEIYEVTKEALEELENDAKVFTLIERVSGAAFFDELFTPIDEGEDYIPPTFDSTSDKKLLGVMCSSGTTGAPKGVCMPHAFVLSFVDPNETSYPAQISRSFSFSPIYWGTGLMSLLLSAFNAGETRITTMHPFNIDLCVEIIEKHQPTSLQLNPSAMLPLLNSPLSKTGDFSSIRMFFCSGSIVNAELRNKFKQVFPEKPLLIFYGMTEVPISAMFPGESYDGLKVGKIVANIYLKVVDEDENNLGIGETGEIRARFEFGFSGYFNNPEATRNALDHESYFKTGDIGYLDEDGNIYILDRNKDVFKHKGFHVMF